MGGLTLCPLEAGIRLKVLGHRNSQPAGFAKGSGTWAGREWNVKSPPLESKCEEDASPTVGCLFQISPGLKTQVVRNPAWSPS